MAMQSGIGLSKIIILAGAGYTGTILFKNGKLSDVIGELQLLVKNWEKSGEHSDGDADYSDAIAQQVKRLTMEIRQLASARQINVLNGNSGQMGNLTDLIIPAAAVGALGYGYMWWKGLKFSDLMYVTKSNMAKAVSNLTKHLDQVTQTLSAAKAHLTQRIQHLDDKMDSQKEISKAIQNDVNAAAENLSEIGTELWQLQRLVSGLDGQIDRLEQNQDITNFGLLYLCNCVQGKKMDMPKALEDMFQPSGRTRPITYSVLGLKEITDSLSRTISEAPANVALQDGIYKLEYPPLTTLSHQPRALLRFNSAKC